MAAKYKILLVEDDQSLGFMLKDNLTMYGYDVRLCMDGEKGLTAFHNDEYQLCILDVMLPLKDGFTLASEIRRYNTQVPIIFLTAKNLKDDRIRGFQLGGDDYIAKPFSLEELLLRIEAILKRTYNRTSNADKKSTFPIGQFVFDFHNQQLTIEENHTRLTNKESKLLRLLAQHKNQVVERDVIMKSIWENEGYFTARSLDVFVSKLRKYLKGDPQIRINNVHGVGYCLEIQL